MTDITTDLNALVTQAQAGDTDAFEALVRRFQDMAVGYAYAQLHDLALAQDAAQEAFIQLYLKLPQLRAPGAFLTWFRRLLYKQCDRLWRRQRLTRVPLDTVTLPAAHEDQPPHIAEAHETTSALAAALAGLSAPERSVIILFYFQEASLKDIGAFLNLAPATVDHRLRSARKHLSERLLTMTHTELNDQRPSRDTSFIVKVRDGLTQVSNLQGLEAQLGAALPTRRGAAVGTGLILLSIDAYDLLVAQQGHVAGDCVVAALAKQLQDQLPPTDFLARVGAHGFAILAPRPAPEHVSAQAETLRAATAERAYRLDELLRPEARQVRPTPPLADGPATSAYYHGVQHLQAQQFEDAVLSFQYALTQDAQHVPSIMELAYLDLRQTSAAARLSEPFHLALSGGVVWLRAGDTVAGLLDRARQGLQRAQALGGGQIVPEQ